MSATSDVWPVYLPTSQAKPLNSIVSHVARGGFYVIASTAERATLLAALAAAGEPAPSASVPLLTWRVDATVGRRIEITTDGVAWNVLAGVLVLADDAFTPATLPPSYPVGESLMSTTDVTWPTGRTSLVITTQQGNRYTQRCCSATGASPTAVYYRSAISTGAWSSWMSDVAPFGMASGSVTLDGATNPTAAVVVTLPTGRFTKAPRVTCNAQTPSWHAVCNATTTTTATFIARNVAALAITFSVSWLAVQMTEANTDG